MSCLNSSLRMTTKLILYFVINTKGYITKTQLVKFLYLADLYAVKWQGKQITDLNWVYYQFGPYEEEIDNELERLKSEGIIKEKSDREANLIQLGENVPSIESLNIPLSMKFMLDNIRREWAGKGKEKFQALLDYVYNTAPMKEVKENGCQPEEKRPLNLLREQEKLLQELA